MTFAFLIKSDVRWQDIFNLGVSTAASGSSEWVQIGIDVYILYQVKPHTPPRV